MFRCERCGSGYSTRAASSWNACPRCLAREQISVPLTFELGWRRSAESEATPEDESERSPPDATAAPSARR